jgi:hypothetical protein
MLFAASLTNRAPHSFPSAKLGKTPIISGSLAYMGIPKERTCTDKKENKIYKEIQRDRVQSHI